MKISLKMISEIKNAETAVVITDDKAAIDGKSHAVIASLISIATQLLKINEEDPVEFFRKSADKLEKMEKRNE